MIATYLSIRSRFAKELELHKRVRPSFDAGLQKPLCNSVKRNGMLQGSGAIIFSEDTTKQVFFTPRLRLPILKFRIKCGRKERAPMSLVGTENPVSDALILKFDVASSV